MEISCSKQAAKASHKALVHSAFHHAQTDTFTAAQITLGL